MRLDDLRRVNVACAARPAREEAMTADSLDHNPERIDRRRLVLSSVATPLFMALSMFLPAGTWAWTRGWLFLGVVLTLGVLAALFIRHVNPELLAARIDAHQGTTPWDKVVL